MGYAISHFFLHFLRAIDTISYLYSNIHQRLFEFSWEAEKVNIKFHKNCENTGKILKISCVICHFVKFDINFGVITDN